MENENLEYQSEEKEVINNDNDVDSLLKARKKIRECVDQNLKQKSEVFINNGKVLKKKSTYLDQVGLKTCLGLKE